MSESPINKLPVDKRLGKQAYRTRLPKRAFNYGDVSSPQEEDQTGGGGERGTGRNAGKRQVRQGAEIELSIAPQTLAIGGCKTQPEHKEEMR